MNDKSARKLRFLSLFEECKRISEQPIKPEPDCLDLFIEVTDGYEALRKVLDGMTKNVLAAIGNKGI